MAVWRCSTNHSKTPIFIVLIRLLIYYLQLITMSTWCQEQINVKSKNSAASQCFRSLSRFAPLNRSAKFRKVRFWCPQEESNLHWLLKRQLLYRWVMGACGNTKLVAARFTTPLFKNPRFLIFSYTGGAKKTIASSSASLPLGNRRVLPIPLRYGMFLLYSFFFQFFQQFFLFFG